jgi:uncharacterized protein
MLRLRGHHLICLHFFSGEGYDDIFKENLRDILARAETEDIEVCEEADQVCEKCPYLKDSKCLYDEHADDEIREMDRAALKLLEVDKDATIKWQNIKKGIPGVFPQWLREYCGECDWKKVCGKNQNYQRLKA